MLSELRLAIIDDGVNRDNLGVALEDDLEISEGVIRERFPHDSFAHSHGTTCVGILMAYHNPLPCTISSIKILSHDHRGTVDDMIIALHWCLEHNIKIVHMSIGTVDFTTRNRLKVLVNKMASEGIVIVAAGDNKGCLTFPAAFTNVVGVRAFIGDIKGKIVLNKSVGVDGIDFLARAVHDVRLGGEMIKTRVSNSFAAPYVTAQVIRFLVEDASLDVMSIKRLLCFGTMDRNVHQVAIFDWCNEYFLCNFSSIPLSRVLCSCNITPYWAINQTQLPSAHLTFAAPSKKATLVVAYDHLLCQILPKLSPSFPFYKNVVLLDVKQGGTQKSTKALSLIEQNYINVSLFDKSSLDFCPEDRSNGSNKSIEVPVIVLCCPYIDGLVSVMLMLKDHFFNSVFHCLCLLDNALGYLCDFLVYRQHNSINNAVLNHLATIHMADLIVIGVHTDTRESSWLANVDLFIHLGEQKYWGSCASQGQSMESIDLGNPIEKLESYLEYILAKIAHHFIIQQ